MPIFEFTSPDGKKYEVSGPEGATEDQAFRILQSQIQSGAAKEAGPPKKYELYSPLEEIIKSVKSIAKDPAKNIPEQYLASAPGRFIQSAARGGMGLLQLLDNAVGASPLGPYARKAERFLVDKVGLPDLGSFNQIIDRSSAAEKEAIQNQGITGPARVAGFAGTLADPVSLKGMSLARGNAPIGQTLGLGARTMQAAKGGALIGLSQPVENVRDYADYSGRKALQVGLSAGVSAAIPPVVAAVGGGAGWVKDFSKALSEKGLDKTAAEKISDLVGKSNLLPVISKLKTAQPAIKGDVRTAGDIVSQLPEGSPIAALQHRAFRGSGGASTLAGKQFEAQKALAENARKDLESRLIPLKEKIFKKVEKTGGVNSSFISKRISDLSGNERIYANPDARRLVDWANKEIARITRPDGSISPEALHIFRTTGLNKKIGDLTKGVTDFAQVESIKKNLVGALSGVKKVVDEGIIKSGGKGWDRWLKAYSNRLGKIEDVEARSVQTMLTKGQYKPTQTTSIGDEISQSPSTVKLLSRPVVWANWVLENIARKKGSYESKINQAITEAMLNPQKLADDLLRISKETGEKISEKMVVPSSILTSQYAGQERE